MAVLASKSAARAIATGKDAGDGKAQEGGDPTGFKSELEAARVAPTTIMDVLHNALYAMEFHKHLAIT